LLLNLGVEPLEALRHVDIVVRGEAEGIWPQVLDDLEAGKAQRVYEKEEFPSLDNIPWARRSLLRPSSYLLFNTIQTTRGCPHSCDFCSVHPFFGGEYRTRPVEDVIEEIKLLKTLSSGPIIFVDDNIFGRRDRAKRLLEQLIPLEVEWFGQASMDTLQNDEFLALAAKSGCRVLFVGLESLSAANLKDINKPWNKPEIMKETVARLDRHKIAQLGAFIIGLPADSLDDVQTIVNFIQESQIPLVQISILTPLPGTECARKLEKDLFDPDYSKRDGSRIVFRHPKIFPPRLLEEELQKAYAYIYSRKAVNERLRGKSGPHIDWSKKVVRGYQIRMNKWLARLGAQGLKI
jgi:radical SAM superfamily enzyme YgiQ (UPF0313 family)